MDDTDLVLWMAMHRRGVLASVATAARYESAACDERNFSSSEERALALGLSLLKEYEGKGEVKQA